MKRKNIVKERFGKLVVIAFGGKTKCRHALWICECDCGTIKPIMGKHLRSGHTRSCGCLHSSDEVRKKISDNHANISGENNPGYGRFGKDSAVWNPNLTDEDRKNKRCIAGYDEWRKLVFERDNFTCQKCGSNKGGTLNAHHIESYNSNRELRTTLSNGITLCKECHDDFHHQYGYGNNTIEQWEEFNGKRNMEK